VKEPPTLITKQEEGEKSPGSGGKKRKKGENVFFPLLRSEGKEGGKREGERI